MARHGTDAKTCGMMNDEQPSRMFMDVLLDVHWDIPSKNGDVRNKNKASGRFLPRTGDSTNKN